MNKGSDMKDLQQQQEKLQKQEQSQQQYQYQYQNQQKRIFNVTEGIRANKTVVTYRRIFNQNRETYCVTLGCIFLQMSSIIGMMIGLTLTRRFYRF